MAKKREGKNEAKIETSISSHFSTRDFFLIQNLRNAVITLLNMDLVLLS